VRNNQGLLEALRNSFYQNFSDLKKTQPIKIDLALSGGMDSMALLVAMCRIKSEIKISLRAIHVHHGISDNADKWVDFCKKKCDLLKVEFIFEKINIKSDISMGVEAAGRKGRYKVFQKYKHSAIALAHHQNDQAETLLLQLFRGSGLKGLSAMQEFDLERKLWRPFLHIKKESIENFIQDQRIDYVNDESNENLNYDRNFLRKRVLPLIQDRYPNIIDTISRSASNIAEGLNLNQSIATEDAKKYFSKDKVRLSLTMLKLLSKERVINLIRWWLDNNNQTMPTKKTIGELLVQISTLKKDTMVNISISSFMSIRAYQDELYLVEKKIELQPYELIWKGQSEIRLPDQSKLLFKKTKGGGLSLSKLETSTLRVQNRVGGERFKPKEKQPTRTLKYLLQSSKIPPWERGSIPLLFLEDQLVVVPNFGIHIEYQAAKEELGWEIIWDKK